MLNSVFSFEEYDPSGLQQGYYPLTGFEDERARKQSNFFPTEDLGGLDDLWSGYDAYQDSSFEKGAPFLNSNDRQCFSEFAAIDDMQLETLSAAIQSFERPITENPKTTETNMSNSLVPDVSELLGSKKEKAYPSLELLSNYRSSYHRLNGEKLNELIERDVYTTEGGKELSKEEGKELSTEEVMRVAAARYIQLSDHTEGDSSLLRHPFGLSFSGLTGQEIENIELASLLLAAAEKVSNQQYNRASNLLRECQELSSYTGNPVQRVVCYFSSALKERIDRETGRLTSKDPMERGIRGQDAIKAMLSNHPVQLVTHSTLPFSQLMQFTMIQTILDNLASAKKIHLVDLSIKHGLQWTILMQTLATRSSTPIDYLKISAVGTSEEAILGTGKRLANFAETLRLPFDFKAVIVSNMQDLKVDMFELEEEEAVGVYSVMDMNTMILRPDSLENLMRVIRKLRPCIMTVEDVEANHNSISFINRFTESLFYYSAFFDCLEGFMDCNDSNRLSIEGNFFSQGICSILATEGSERVVRHVGLSMWRSFFARFGIMEAELSEWTLYQATLLVKQFANGSSCTFDMSGKSLILGWKGTPLLFVSAWKLQ